MGARRSIDRCDEILGRARARGHADDARVAERVEVELVGAVDPHDTIGQPASLATFASATVFDELALPITTTASASRRDLAERRLAVRGREAEVVAGRGPQLRELARGRGP